MTQTKSWAIVVLAMTWLLTSMTVQARNLPEFTELVEENADAVVNISTKVNKDDDCKLSVCARYATRYGYSRRHTF
jgi:serine protease Do